MLLGKFTFLSMAKYCKTFQPSGLTANVGQNMWPAHFDSRHYLDAAITIDLRPTTQVQQTYDLGTIDLRPRYNRPRPTTQVQQTSDLALAPTQSPGLITRCFIRKVHLPTQVNIRTVLTSTQGSYFWSLVLEITKDAIGRHNKN